MNRFFILLFGSVCLHVAVLFGSALYADEAVNYFNTAKIAFDSGNYEQSKRLFNDFIVKYPSHAQANEAMFYLAESFLNLREYESATTYYNRLTGLDLNNPYARVALFRLGDIPYIQGQYDIAKPRLEQFVEQLPHDTKLQFVLYYLGDIAMRSGAAAEAEWYFGQSERMFPAGARIVESKLGLAWAKNQLGQQTNADEIFRQLLASTDPLVLEPTTFQWGVIQFERGDSQGAMKTLNEFLSRWPGSVYYADAQRVLARSKGAQGDYSGALQILNQIMQPTVDDSLMKVRCLYGTGQVQDAQTLLTSVERTAGNSYMDEIAFLKSVFYFDRQDWATTIETLGRFLLPNYNATTGKMSFGYATLPAPAGGHKLSEETYIKACALLALSYARQGRTDMASATVNEMRGELAGSTALANSREMQEIVAETQNRLTEILAQNNQNPGTGTSIGSGGQWTPNGGNTGVSGGNPPSTGTNQQWTPNWNYGGNSQNQSGTAQGTDLERFWQASQLFDKRQWNDAAVLLDQLLQAQYNSWSKQFYINYAANGSTGSLNEATLARACSLLAQARGELGDFNQAGAIYTAFAARARSDDSVQQELLKQTYDRLTQLSQGGYQPGTSNPFNPANPSSGTGSLLSESEQRRILKECLSYYNIKRFEQVDTKLKDLMDKRPSDAVMAEAALLRSKALLELDREHEAITLLETIVKDHSSTTQYADALWFLGLYYESSSDSYKAVEYFQLLADRFPNYKNIDGALYFLALDDLENGNGRRASQYLKRINQNFQNGKYWSHATWTLAYESYKQKDYSQSENYLKKVLQHPPDAAILDRVLFLKGDLALRKKEYETALVAFREVGRLCPHSPLRDDADRNMQIAAKNASAVR